jgi:hypothetical protein
MPERLTRLELYNLVWSEPMRTLASRFGLSDVALRKACSKAEVPVPPRGYWAKIHAGRTALPSSLPARPPGMPRDIVIGANRDAWQSLTEEEILGPVPDPPVFEERIDALRERVRKKIGRFSTPRSLDSAHPIITRLLEEDARRAELARSGEFVLSWRQPVFESTIARRRLRILNGVFLAAARAGGKPWIREHEAVHAGVTVHQQNINLRLEQVEHSSKKKRSPTVASTRLRLSIITSSDREFARWDDVDGGRLESRSAEIATEIFMLAEVQYREWCDHQHRWRTELKQRREEEIRTRRAEDERKERKRQAAIEKARLDRLLSQAELLRQADDIRAYVDAAYTRANTINPPPDPVAVEAWRAAALAEADRIDPLVSGAFLAEIEPDSR